MSGINVLSDSLNGGSRLDKTSSQKGKNAVESLDNSTAEFAVMLSGLTNINADPIGQNPKIGQDLEAGQDPSSLGQNLEYGHFLLSFLSQPISLGDLPAGKEANSGNGVNQGTGEGLSADGNLSIISLNKLFLDSNEVFTFKGTTSQMPQGNNPGTTELDKYRYAIADLLLVLNGEITDSERGTSERQEMMKLIQGWLTVRDDVVENDEVLNPVISGQNNNGQTLGNIEGYTSLHGADFENVDNEANSKMVTTLSTSRSAITDSSLEGTALVLERDVAKNAQKANAQIIDGHSVGNEVYSKILNSLSPSNGVEDIRQVIARTVQDWMQRTDNSPEEEHNFRLQKVIKPLIDFLTTEQGTRSGELSQKASSFLTALSQILSQETNVPQRVNKEVLKAKSDREDTFFNQLNRISHVLETAAEASKDTFFLQGVSSEEGSKGDLVESSELPGAKTSQHLNLGIGLDGKIVTSNVADGKTVAIPVWEQISNVFREQVSSRNRELKELDIQLHPAELGRIRIGLRWENGQVHLQVHASEAATNLIIQNQLSELRHTLTNQGVNCGMLQMGQHGRDQQQNQNHQRDQFHRTNDSYANKIEDEEQFLGVNSPSHGEVTNGINVTA